MKEKIIDSIILDENQSVIGRGYINSPRRSKISNKETKIVKNHFSKVYSIITKNFNKNQELIDRENQLNEKTLNLIKNNKFGFKNNSKTLFNKNTLIPIKKSILKSDSLKKKSKKSSPNIISRNIQPVSIINNEFEII